MVTFLCLFWVLETNNNQEDYNYEFKLTLYLLFAYVYMMAFVCFYDAKLNHTK